SARLHDGRRPRADPQARRPVRRRPDDAPADRQGAERPALSTGPRPRPPQTAPFGPEVARVQPFRLLRTPSRCLAPGVSLLAPAGASAVGVEALRMAEHSELGEVSAEEEGDGPVDDDTGSPLRQRELVQVVRPRHEPADEAAQTEAEDVRDSLVAAERRDLAEHPVPVRLEVAADVLRQPARLAQRVLARRRVWRVALRVRHARAVAQRPDTVDAAHAQELVDLDASAL